MTCHQLYKSLTSAPEELRDLHDTILLLVGPLRFVFEHIQGCIPAQPQLGVLQDHLERIDNVVTVVEHDLKALKEQHATIQDVAKSTRKLIIHGARLSSYYELLRRYFSIPFAFPISLLSSSMLESAVDTTIRTKVFLQPC